MQNRPLVKVIEAIGNIIPADHPDRVGIDARMQDLSDTVAHTAPELMGERWGRFASLLAAIAPDPYGEDAPAWAKTMANVFAGKENYQDHLPKTPVAPVVGSEASQPQPSA